MGFNISDLLLYSNPITAPIKLTDQLTGHNLGEALSGGGGNTRVPQGQLISYEMPAAPELQPYTGRTATWAPMPQGYRATTDSIQSLLAPGSAYSNVLAGDTNQENFNRAVVIPNQQQLTTSTIPQIQSLLGNTPYGGSVYSGARDEAVAGAVVDNANKIADLRYQDQQKTTQNMLSAAGQIPSFSNVYLNERSQNINQQQSNLNRQIDVHFKNQQLAQQEFQNSMQQLGVDLGVQEFNANMDLTNQGMQYQQQQIQQAQQAGIYSTIGSILGAAVGSAGGPAGAIVGSTLGGQAGSVAGGGNASPAATTDAISSYLLYSALTAQPSNPSVSGTAQTSSGSSSVWEDGKAYVPGPGFGGYNDGSLNYYSGTSYDSALTLKPVY